MSFEDARIWSCTLTFAELAGRFYLCFENKNHRSAYFYLSVIYLKVFNVGIRANRIILWKYAIKAYKRYKTPR